MTGFIVGCVNAVLYPLPVQNGNGLDTKISELKQNLSNLHADLKDLLDQRDLLINTHATKSPDLETRILKFLKETGPSSEFMIGQELGEKATTVYHVCCELKKQKKINVKNDGVWYIAD
jgi:hypothetical protein